MLTAERLRAVLKYNQRTGEFRWKMTLSIRAAHGAVAGYRNKIGYVEIRVDNKLYLGHRLAWFYVHGEWPKGELDHKDGYSNRIANLREATSTQNKANTKKQANNTSGFKGVCRAGRKCLSRPWAAVIHHSNKKKFLGYFLTAPMAAQAYDVAAVNYFGEFARTNKGLGLLP